MVEDRFTGKIRSKQRDAFAGSYCELKVYAAAEIPDLMKRLKLAYDLKHGLIAPSHPPVPA